MSCRTCKDLQLNDLQWPIISVLVTKTSNKHLLPKQSMLSLKYFDSLKPLQEFIWEQCLLIWSLWNFNALYERYFQPLLYSQRITRGDGSTCWIGGATWLGISASSWDWTRDLLLFGQKWKPNMRIKSDVILREKQRRQMWNSKFHEYVLPILHIKFLVLQKQQQI